uniref:C2H2-type domain-containing protein n=1 Tax=Glossina austeni TaxID=7395 RepID=A0A1A9UWX0_GLOAU
MAVFLLNICKFNGCGITFPSLGDLIQHIEDTHIDYDPKVVEQKEQAQPACLPLSYVLRFISDDARKESPFLTNNAAGVELKRKLAIKHHSYSMSSSNRSNTPTGSEMDEDEMVVSESEDSNDSWTTEEFSSEFIMRYGSRHSGSGSNGTPGNEKPFACPVPGCKKRYKNVNGIKYHSKNGHKKDGKVRKGYKCHCGKSYKTAQGLKSHALVAHNSSPENVVSTQHVGSVLNTGESRSSSPFSGQLLATAIPNQHLNTIATNNCFYAALAPAQVAPPTIASATAAAAAAAAVGSATAAATTCLPAISPTFIEHKYSANTFKEKFYANLRQHYSSSNNKLKQLKTNNIVSGPCDNGNKKNAYRSKGAVLNSIDRKVVDGDGGGGGGGDNSSFTEIGGNSINNDKSNKIPTFSNNGITSNGETAIIAVCSIKKQLNENVKNNLYKKFIN